MDNLKMIAMKRKTLQLIILKRQKLTNDESGNEISENYDSGKDESGKGQF